MNQSISPIFYKIINDEYSGQDIKLLFNYCQKIAEVYARTNSKVRGKNLEKWNNTLNDLVSESVAPLFTLNCKGKLNLQQSYDKWELPINEDSDIDFFLHRLVWRSVEQRINSLLKESDPFFAKILKTISMGVAHNDYIKVNYFGKVYIIHASEKEIEGAVIPLEEIWNIPQNYFLNKQKNLLDGLMSYLKENTDYFPAIPLNEIIKRIKNLYLNNNIRPKALDEFEMIEIIDLIKNANQNIINKINSSYVQNNKLNKDEVKKIIGIFNVISSDLVNGSMKGNLVDYFEETFQGIPKSMYYDKYQKILNYLYKIFRNEIASKL